MRLYYMLALCAVLSSCKSTKANRSTTLANLSFQCASRVDSNAVYSPTTLTQELEKSIRLAAKNDGAIDLLADFFPRVQIVKFLSSKDATLLDYEKKACSTVEAINKSTLGLVGNFAFQTGPNLRTWGGAVIYGNDVFPQGQFESRSDQFAIPQEFSRPIFQQATDFTKGSAWFEWRDGGFIFHEQGGSERILAILGRKQKELTIYRGAGLDTSHTQGLLSFRQDSSAFGKDPFDILQGIFFTDSIASAKKWANPYVAALTVPLEKLVQLAQSRHPSLWIGFSHGNIDIAVIRNTKNPETLEILSSAKKFCRIKDGTLASENTGQINASSSQLSNPASASIQGQQTDLTNEPPQGEELIEPPLNPDSIEENINDC